MAGTTSYLSVQATSPEGSSAWSNELNAQPNALAPAAPYLTSIVGSASVTSSAAIDPAATSYRFYRRTPNHDWLALPSSLTPRLSEPAQTSIEVKYAIQTVSADGVSNWDIGAWLVPDVNAPPAPNILSVVPGNGRVVVSFTPVLNAASYTLSTAPTAGGPFTPISSSYETFDDSVTLSGTNGLPLFVAIRATSSVQGDASALASATPAANLPTVPTPSSAAGFEGIQLDWAPVTGATAYRLFRRFPTTQWRPLVTVSTPGWRDLAVENGESPQYELQVVNVNGSSGRSLAPARLVDATLPPVPTNVRAQVGLSAIQISWDPLAGATGYRAELSTNFGVSSYTACYPTGLWETRCPVAATNAQETWVRVYAVNPVGSGLASAWITGLTPSATRPSSTGLTATPQPTPGTVRLTWSAVASASSYRVYRRPSAGPVTQVTEVATTTYDDTQLASGGYVYYLEAVNAVGPGVWTQPTPATVP